MDSHKLTSKGTNTPQGSVNHQQNQCYSSLLGRVQALTASKLNFPEQLEFRKSSKVAQKTVPRVADL
jgi:hypothetical protein